MRHHPSRRRFIFFSFWGVLLVAVLLTVAIFSLKNQLRVENWTDILSEPERKALAEAAMEAPLDFGGDKNLDLPGVHFFQESVLRQADGKLMQVQGTVESGNPARVASWINAFWHEQGLRQTISQDYMIAADPEKGVLYSVYLMPNPDNGDETLVSLWRFREGDAEAPVTHPRSDLLPALPAGNRNLELGQAGKPGYAMMFDFNASPPKAYEIVFNELKERGWEPFEAATHFDRAEGTVLGKSLVSVLRHQSEPLGCQLMVGMHPDRGQSSQVFISLF